MKIVDIEDVGLTVQMYNDQNFCSHAKPEDQTTKIVMIVISQHIIHQNLTVQAVPVVKVVAKNGSFTETLTLQIKTILKI